MGYRYNLNDRTFGGSMDPRLAPDIVRRGLNEKIGGAMPRPMVHCNDREVPDQQGGRRARIGLPDKFTR